MSCLGKIIGLERVQQLFQTVSLFALGKVEIESMLKMCG